MPPQTPENGDEQTRIPSSGDRVEREHAGVTLRGTVHYADRIQILVKWDNGSSSSLRLGRDRFRLVDANDESSAA